MGWTLESAKVYKVTAKLAEEFAKLETIMERPLSERRLMVYERIIKANAFRPCTWAKAWCEQTGQWYRVNGQHTSTLFARIADTIAVDLFVTVEVYKAETLEDVSRLWSTFDDKLASRTTSDINHSFAQTVEELRDVPRRLVDACVSGISLHKAGSRGGEMARICGSPQERAEQVIEHSEFVRWVADLLDDKKTNHLSRAGVVAAMFATYSKAKKMASEFWQAVRDETGATPDCPDRQLAKWLGQVVVWHLSDMPGVKSRRADSREMYVRSIHAWNAYRRGQKLERLKYHKKSKIPSVA
jgi:hypothetical protein